MSWRVANAIHQLQDQVNAKFPKRSKVADGTIGDVAHAARASDHNPRGGIVYGVDITNDPENGIASRALAEALVASRDSRIKYIISNGQICSGAAGPSPWVWRKYTGANGHFHHCHLSVVDIPSGDSTVPWKLDGIAKPAEHTIAEAKEVPLRPTLMHGSSGALVKELQTKLGTVYVDSVFGDETDKAVRALQKARGLVVDGQVGMSTWEVVDKLAKV